MINNNTIYDLDKGAFRKQVTKVGKITRTARKQRARRKTENSVHVAFVIAHKARIDEMNEAKRARRAQFKANRAK